MQHTNPFFHRGPVQDPTHFVGREQEIQTLCELLRSGQSIAINGSRRFGKTSLLFNISSSRVSAQNHLFPSQTCWVYLDGGMLYGLDEEWFFGAIARNLGEEIDSLNYVEFVERLRNLARNNMRLIVMLDEFELIAANPKFGITLFNRLRGLASQFALQFITVSKLPLAKLTFAQPDVLGSPFFNIFAPLLLGPLKEREALELLIKIAALGGCHFDDSALRFLFRLSGPHPLFLQVTGYHAFGLHQAGQLSPEHKEIVRERVRIDLSGHLEYYWRNLNDDEQFVLAALPLIEPGSHVSTLEKLTQSGLLIDGDYLGEVLEQYVRRQKITSLLQTGAFLMDTQRKVVAVQGEQVHLTRTEFMALKFFLENPGRLITLEDLESILWPGEVTTDLDRSRGIVKRLRTALGKSGSLISNHRGQGYVLHPD